MKTNARIALAALLATTVLLAPVAGIAQDKPKTPPPGKTEAKPDPGTPPARPIPFRGTVAEVNKDAKTVKVGERVFHVAADTRLMKDGKAITLADITVGEAIAGNYVKGDDGKLTAKMMRIGQRPPPEKAPQAEKPKDK